MIFKFHFCFFFFYFQNSETKRQNESPISFIMSLFPPCYVKRTASFRNFNMFPLFIVIVENNVISRPRSLVENECVSKAESITSNDIIILEVRTHGQRQIILYKRFSLACHLFQQFQTLPPLISKKPSCRHVHH